MSARDVIAAALFRRVSDAKLADLAFAQADSVTEALTAAGYSIIHDSENHGPTVERAVVMADNVNTEALAIYEGDAAAAAREVASTIRAMTTGGRE